MEEAGRPPPETEAGGLGRGRGVHASAGGSENRNTQAEDLGLWGPGTGVCTRAPGSSPDFLYPPKGSSTGEAL